MGNAQPQKVVRALLERGGSTYAEAAGIHLVDKPSPLFRLLVLASLLSKPIAADMAVAAARELATAGYRTPRAMIAASWQDRVDALGRAHYRRYDESTATRLGESAELVLERYHGDLRELAAAAGEDTAKAGGLLQDFPGIGPTGADIFLREVQAVWPWVRPYVDAKVTEAARKLHLPHTARSLTDLAGTDDLSRLSAALIRVLLDDEFAAAITSATA